MKISEAIREECAKAAAGCGKEYTEAEMAERRKEATSFAYAAGRINARAAIRALPSSTQQEGK